MKKISLVLFVLSLFLLIGMLTGCRLRSGENPDGPGAGMTGRGTSDTLPWEYLDGGENTGAGTAASVRFQIVLPGTDRPTEANGTGIFPGLPSVRAVASGTPLVTCRLILVNAGNAAQPTTTLVKTVPVDASGTAQAFFAGVPARTCVGEVHIEGGMIGTYTDFHGAADLVAGADNLVSIKAKGSKSIEDFVAEAVLKIVTDSGLFQLIGSGLAGTLATSLEGRNLETLTTDQVVLRFANPLEIDLGEGVKMRFAEIPSGTFTMGSPDTEPNRAADEVQHQVTISQPFYLGVFEVTQTQYQRLTDAAPSFFHPLQTQYSAGYADTAGHPVEQVMWWDCVAFCNTLSLNQNLTPCYRNQGGSTTIVSGDTVTCDWTADGFRLPTESEWEYACRAGGTARFFWGGDDAAATIKPYAWYYLNTYDKYWTDPHAVKGGTQPAGTTLPNAFGLYDMTGNVWEWCWDWNGSYPTGPVTDPRGPDAGDRRALRGGSWMDDSFTCRSAYRTSEVPLDRFYYYSGFRICRVPKKPQG